MSQHCASRNKRGKTAAHNAEGSVLHALRSSLRFQNILCQEALTVWRKLGNGIRCIAAHSCT
ncbi:unnamed protein product [Brassica rapa subsp. trilocularis]